MIEWYLRRLKTDLVQSFEVLSHIAVLLVNEDVFLALMMLLMVCRHIRSLCDSKERLSCHFKRYIGE